MTRLYADALPARDLDAEGGAGGEIHVGQHLVDVAARGGANSPGLVPAWTTRRAAGVVDEDRAGGRVTRQGTGVGGHEHAAVDRGRAAIGVVAGQVQHAAAKLHKALLAADGGWRR